MRPQLCIALLLTGCPSDSNPTDNETDGGTTNGDATESGGPTAPATMTATMTAGPGTGTDASTTNPTTTDPTTTDPTTDATTTDDTTTDDTSGSESGSSSTGAVACPYTEVAGDPDVTLEEVADGFREPVLVVGDPVDTDVLYVVQKRGEIKRLMPGDTEAPDDDWLDLPVISSDEAGLLGLAFHPDYDTDPRIYVAHTPSGEGGAVYVTEFTVEDGDVDLTSARDVIGVGQPQTNHNGGMIQFGPDGMLYISIGDGGVQDDGCDHGQATGRLLGKILRIDPETDGAPDSTPGCSGGGACGCGGESGFDYTIPGDNPFVGMGGIRDEIYAYGFRNPWRFSFDYVEEQLWVADVGQDAWEEVSVIQSGDNAGWGDMEANHCFNDNGCDASAALGELNSDGLRAPVAEYANAAGAGRCSIVGLGNYRSCEVPGWAGRYYYADLCTAEVWSVSYDGKDVENQGVVTSASDFVYGGGYNAHGDVYLTEGDFFGGGTTPIYRIAPD